MFLNKTLVTYEDLEQGEQNRNTVSEMLQMRRVSLIAELDQLLREKNSF